jgi:hypothetical protein
LSPDSNNRYREALFDLEPAELRSRVKSHSRSALLTPVAAFGQLPNATVLVWVLRWTVSARAIPENMTYQRTIFQPRLLGKIRSSYPNRSALRYRIVPGLGQQLLTVLAGVTILASVFLALVRPSDLFFMFGPGLASVGLFINWLFFGRNTEVEEKALIEWVEQLRDP